MTRLFRSSRHEARNGRRTSRLCTVASDLRLLMPVSSPTSVHSGGVPPWTRHELPQQRLEEDFIRGNKSSESVDKTAEEPRGGEAGGAAAHLLDGFAGVAEQPDIARRATGAGHRKGCDGSRRRSRQTAAKTHRWTRLFGRDFAAAPQQVAHRARPSDSGKAGKRAGASESRHGEARAGRTGLASVRSAIRAQPRPIITRCGERPMGAHMAAKPHH